MVVIAFQVITPKHFQLSNGDVMKSSIFYIAREITLSIFCAGLFAHTVHAVEITCPAEITLSPVAVPNAPKGWSVSQRSRSLFVQGAGITVGPPSQREDLKPDIENIRDQRMLNWEFDGSDSRKEMWLSCGYGDALVLLSKKLPSGLSKCHSYGLTHDVSGYAIVRVVCD